MSDRLIYRPNHFTPDEWDNLSREQQIRWWKDRQPKRSSPHPRKGLRLYAKGTITKAEIPGFVFDNLTEDNLEEFIGSCPEDVLQLLRNTAASFPADGDDQGWSQLVRIQGVCYPPWVTQEEIRQELQERDRRFREGVRVLRKTE